MGYKSAVQIAKWQTKLQIDTEKKSNPRVHKKYSDIIQEFV